MALSRINNLINCKVTKKLAQKIALRLKKGIVHFLNYKNYMIKKPEKVT